MEWWLHIRAKTLVAPGWEDSNAVPEWDVTKLLRRGCGSNK